MSDVLTVVSDSLEMEIAPAISGRVCALRFQGKNLLAEQDAHPENWGATYWTSPQADWGWPPLKEVDGLTYEVLERDAEVVLRSPAATLDKGRFRIEKRFRAGPSGTIDIEYVLENLGSSPFRLASWEISRVPPGGVTFFPTGEAELTPVPPHFEMVVEKVAGTTFYDHGKFEQGRCLKLHADGQGGYLAHLSGRTLILKAFRDSAPENQAPGEGECEIFANDDGKYVEVEVQGPYDEVRPGTRASFLIRTAVVVLPTELDPSDRVALRSFADAQVAPIAV